MDAYRLPVPNGPWAGGHWPPAPPETASPVVPATSDASANSAEQRKDKPDSEHDDPDRPHDRDLDQEADDEQNHTENDHEIPLSSNE